MPRIVDLEDEPLDGDDYGGSEGHGYDDEYDDSTADGNSLDDEGATGIGRAANGGSSGAAAPVTLPESEYRESLGFLRASRKLALPGAGFDAADDGRIVALAALDRFGLLLVSSATGILVYAIEDLSSAAFGRGGQQQQQQQDPALPVPVRADVALAGRPSRMLASRDNLRVAVAVGDKVLVFDTASLVNSGGGGAAAAPAAPVATVALSSPDAGDAGDLPPRALSW
ncbi:unnamed protein product, partial [Ectocarpus sp. 13 AM-2016]